MSCSSSTTIFTRPILCASSASTLRPVSRSSFAFIRLTKRGSLQEHKTPVLETVAKDNKGINELIDKIKNHNDYLKKSNKFEDQRRLRYETELVEIIRKRLMNFIFDEDQFKDKVETLIDQISKKQIDPYTAADEILGKILK